MAQLYVWRPYHLSTEKSEARFARSLENQCSFFNKLLSTGCKTHYKRIGKLFVGQITSELGILDWRPWQEYDHRGVAWSGVCEDFLGPPLDRTRLNRLVADILEAPQKLVNLTGNFSVCGWDARAENVSILTSATQPRTLWQTEGPDGVAIGSRASLILDLVGRPKELDEEEASVFIAYNYLLTDGALFRHVNRIPARTHLCLTAHQPVRSTMYVSLGEYLGEPTTNNLDEAAGLCAEHLKARVDRQLGHSRDPVLHLTGGRDSRLIAAALSHAPYRPSASTGGALRSADVRIASLVATCLGFRHVIDDSDHTTDNLLAPLAENRAQAHAWTRMSEGVETLRHAMHYRDFFTGCHNFPNKVHQGFNGLHAGLQKPHILSPTQFPGGLNKTLGPHFRFQETVKERFQSKKLEIDRELHSLDAPSSRWGELYYWTTRALHWGQDNLLVKDLLYWYWTPLFDKTLIQAGWHLPLTDQASTKFVEAMTLKLRRDLHGIPFQDSIELAEKTMVRRAQGRLRRSMSRLQHLITKGARPDARTIWTQLLYDTPHPAWPELIDEAFVRAAIQGGRNAEILWRIATIQLFCEAWHIKK